MASKFECNPRRPGKYGIEGFYAVGHVEGEEGEVKEQFRLYRVRAAWRLKEGEVPQHAEVFVLAQSERDACEQAECGLRLDPKGFMPQTCLHTVEGSVVLVAEPVPFFVRGWSGQQF